MRACSISVSAVLLAVGALGAGCTSPGSSTGAGAGSDPGTQATNEATIELPLLRQNGGNQYRLTAMFQITEADGTVVPVDGTGDDASVSVSVTPGIDKIEILDGWTMSRSTDNGMTFTPVSAVLASSSSVNLIISPNNTSFWEFDFIVRDANTQLQIGFGAFDAANLLTGSLFVNEAFGDFRVYNNSVLPISIYFVGDSATQIEADGTHDRVYSAGITATDAFSDAHGLLGPLVKKLDGGFLTFTTRAHADGSEDFSGTYNSSFGSDDTTFPQLTFDLGEVFGGGLDADGFPLDAPFVTFNSSWAITSSGIPALVGVVENLNYTPGAPGGQLPSQP